jgi:hypothetical protein
MSAEDSLLQLLLDTLPRDSAFRAECQAALRALVSRRAQPHAWLALVSSLGSSSPFGLALLRCALDASPLPLLACLFPDQALWTSLFTRPDGAPSAAALAWFSTGAAADGRHGGGSASLLRFALARRNDGAWAALAWRGRPLAPCTVTSRPAAWCELDCGASLTALFRLLPPRELFGPRSELVERLEEAAAVAQLAPDFFVSQLAARPRDPRLTSALSESLGHVSPSLAAERLLPPVAAGGRLLPSLPAFRDAGQTSISVADVPFCVRWESESEALLASALCGGQAQLAESCSASGELRAALEQVLGQPEEAFDVDGTQCGTGEARAVLRVLLHAWLRARRAASAESGEGRKRRRGSGDRGFEARLEATARGEQWAEEALRRMLGSEGS